MFTVNSYSAFKWTKLKSSSSRLICSIKWINQSTNTLTRGSISSISGQKCCSGYRELLLMHRSYRELSPSYAPLQQSTPRPTACESLITTLSAGIFGSSTVICLQVSVFKRACQNLSLHSSLTAWNTGSNLIRCDPKLHVRVLVADREQQTCEAHRYLWTCVCSDQGSILDHFYIRNKVLTARIMNLLYLSVLNSGFMFITSWGMRTLNLFLFLRADEVDTKVLPLLNVLLI